MPPEVGVVGAIPPKADVEREAPQDEKPVKVLPTDRLAFAKQIDLLRAYAVGSGAAGKIVTLADLANLTQFPSTSVGLNNTFFSDVGAITKVGNGYTAAAEVLSYNRQLEFDSATAGHKLAPLFLRAWFAERLVPLLRMRQSLSERECISQLADAAAAGAKYTPQLRALLEYLQLSGLIMREGGVVQLGPTARETPAADDGGRRELAPVGTPPESAQPTVRTERSGAVNTSYTSAPAGNVAFHVDVNVNMQEMATWKPELVLAFFDGIARVIAAKAKVEQEAAR
jgi:hypothetical protein